MRILPGLFIKYQNIKKNLLFDRNHEKNCIAISLQKCDWVFS
jgi:hypothetical protein